MLFEQRMSHFDNLALRMCKKPLASLSSQEIGAVTARCREEDDALDDKEVDWLIDDAQELRTRTLGGQLAEFHVDPDLVEDFQIKSTEYGRIGSGKLRIPGSTTVLRIETPRVKLRVPNMADEQTAQLEDMQIYAQFADDAKKSTFPRTG